MPKAKEGGVDATRVARKPQAWSDHEGEWNSGAWTDTGKTLQARTCERSEMAALCCKGREQNRLCRTGAGIFWPRAAVGLTCEHLEDWPEVWTQVWTAESGEVSDSLHQEARSVLED